MFDPSQSLTETRLTGGQALARALRPESVRHVFGVAGGKIAPFLKALAAEPDLNYVGTRHEATGAFMAAAVYAATGRIAVTFAEMGPGTGNIVAGIASAHANRLPLLLVTSNNQQSASYPPRGMFMELDNLAVLRPVTTWNAAIHDGRRIPELVRQAFREALTGRHGPVHLDVPQNVLLQSFTYHPGAFDWTASQYRTTAPSVPGADQIASAADLLAGAERPLLIAGGGVARARAETAFRALGARLDAPMTATQMGIGCVAADDPRFIGHGGLLGGPAVIRAFAEAEVVLAAGCRFSSWLWDGHGPMVRPGQKLIHLDLDPAVIGALVPVEISLPGCASATLPLLEAALRGHPAAAPRAWTQDLAREMASHRAMLSALAAEREPVMHPAALAAEIARHLPAGAMVAFDGGHTSFWSNDYTPVTEPRMAFHEPGMAQLGFGLPYGLALKISHPERPVFNITGDGAFGFTLMELDTARRQRLPVINIVHNNASWGVIASGQARAGFTLGTDLDGTDYAAIARGFGCFGEIVTAPDEVGPALGRAFASGLPAVLDCRTRFVPHPALPAFGAMGQAGIE